jgi:hypothetical protein
MKFPQHPVWIAALLLCIGSVIQPADLLYAQRFTERHHILNPLSVRLADVADSNDTELTWIPTFQGWGGFEGYLLSDDEHAWGSHLGAVAEIVRIGNSESLAVMSTLEHVANAKNDISFNPRAVWWEEGLFYTKRLASAPNTYWQLGYYHRCKHEVDNLELNLERVLIYGSLTGKYITQTTVGQGLSTLALRADLFTIYRDYRTPRLPHTAVQPSYENLIGTLGANWHYRAALPLKQLGWYAKAHLRLTAFSDRSGFVERFSRLEHVAASGGASVGLSVESPQPGGGRLELGLRYEYLADPEIRPFPAPQHLITLGFTFLAPQIW